MPRPRRIQLESVAHHVIIRGNNRAPMFFSDADREFFLRCMHNGAAATGCDIHSYVLMTNHVHLMVTPRVPGALSRMMQEVGRRYVENVNLLYGRTGTLFEGRFKTKPILTMPQAMNTLLYIEQNPLRAGMVAHIGGYPWSSARHHLGLLEDAGITEHAVFLALGGTRGERTAAFSRQAERPLDDDSLAEVRAPPRRGRPRKDGAGGQGSSGVEPGMLPAPDPGPEGRPPAS